ncbi:MAG: phosphosulfolactate synthase, partial [Burkholderiales bacterium]|nr:phosphosulfolactate synthase [Burkholderiales bacterium]
GERGIADLLDVAADYIDYAKIYAMNALLIPGETVKRTTKLYLDAGVMPFAGGILFEYAWHRNELDGLIALLKRLAIPGLEISENYVTLSEDERARMIDLFQKAGIKVVYEFGRKNPEDPLSLDYLEGIVRAVAAQGIHHVTVEQCEMDLLAKDAPQSLKTLSVQDWFDHVVIEADPYCFPHQHVQMLRDFGRDVNLANIAPWRLRLELDQTQLAIAAATGRTTDLIRPPFSSTPDAVTGSEWASLQRMKGYRVVYTDLDTEDWRKPGIADIVKSGTPAGDDGAVVMLHDGGGNRAETVAALEQLIVTLKARGYTFDTVSEAARVPSAWHQASRSQEIRGTLAIGLVRTSNAVVDL